MDKKEKDLTLAGFMGAIFIVIGFIGMITIVTSFDFESYNELNDFGFLLDEEEMQLELMKEGLRSTWTLGIGLLIIHQAIGAVLITLRKILRVLEDIRDKGNSNSLQQNKTS